METMTENKGEIAGAGESLNTLEVEGGLLLELLEGVSSHASKDKSLPTLNAVEVEGESEDKAKEYADECFNDETMYDLLKHAKYTIVEVA